MLYHFHLQNTQLILAYAQSYEYLSISIVFLIGVDVNFKALLKTLTCLCVRHVLDKFITLG